MAIREWVLLARSLAEIAAAKHPRTSKANPNIRGLRFFLGFAQN